MRPREARDSADLIGRAATGIARTAQRTQEGVTDVVYDLASAALGPAVTPIRHAHRGMVRGVYGCVRLGLRTASAVAGQVAAGHGAETGAPTALSDAPPTRRWVAALNGLVGDQLSWHGSSLALSMSLRAGDTDVEPTRAALAAAYGLGHRRLAVFVHGLVEDDSCWSYRRSRVPPDRPDTLPGLVQEEFGYLPLLVRYNTGAPITDNGAALAALLDEVAAAWPGPIEELMLVGHSMGGLLIHSALERGHASWTTIVTRIITLGSPIDGAPLERAATTLAHAASVLPPILWLEDVLSVRSQGITDLGRSAGPFPQTVGARRLIVYGSLSPWPHPVSDRFGDGMVPVPSIARRREDPFGPSVAAQRRDAVVVLAGVGHQALLNHHRMHSAVAAWLRN